MATIISGIYEIKNTVNGHCYIGSAVNIGARWAIHRSLLKNKKHHSRHLQNAWNKYGESCFVFSVIEQCEKVRLIEREQYYIDEHNPVYNVAPKAWSNFGIKYSDETLAKMKAAQEKRSPSMMGEGNHFFGKKHGTEARVKMSLANKGRALPNEQKKSISIGIKAWWDKQTTEARKKRASKIKGNKWNVGKKQSAETIAKRAAKLKGKHTTHGHVLTAEHKEKVAIGVRAYWAKKKQEKDFNA